MRVLNRHLDADVIDGFIAAVNSGELGRTDLARRLCELMKWRSMDGKWNVAQALKVLPIVAEHLNIQLPPSQRKAKVRKALVPTESFSEYFYTSPLKINLSDAGTISVQAVRKEDYKKWAAMMHFYHPQGVPHHPGACLRFWIASSVYGIIGGFSFHAASWHQAARDKSIGWCLKARSQNLGYVVNNGRFLILPNIRIPNLASLSLKLAVDKVKVEWKKRYGKAPRLLYTYVDPSYNGTSYLAAGWKKVGQTKGKNEENKGSKDVFTLPLCPDFQSKLQKYKPLDGFELITSRSQRKYSWEVSEYGQSSYPCKKTRDRLFTIGKELGCSMEGKVSRLFNEKNARRTSYYFFSNDAIDQEDILESHVKNSISRAYKEKVCLVLQDTTFINYTKLKKTKGLTKNGKGKGMAVHVQFAVNDKGMPLGTLSFNADFKTADPNKKKGAESARWTEGLRIAARAGNICKNTRVISVSDREGDIYDLLEEQKKLADNVGYVVRVNSARRYVIAEDSEPESLLDYMQKQDMVGGKYIYVRSHGTKKIQPTVKVRVGLRMAKVTLKPPHGREDAEPLKATAVLATGKKRGVDGEFQKFSWLLLTSEERPEGTFAKQWAKTIVDWYSRRWKIEEFFRVLKSGCKVEEHGLKTTSALKKHLAFDCVTAWRVMYIRHFALIRPTMMASKVIQFEEIVAIYALLKSDSPNYAVRAPPNKWTVEDLTLFIGRLAGFQRTKVQKYPGDQLMWIALKRLSAAMNSIAGYQNAMIVDPLSGKEQYLSEYHKEEWYAQLKS